MANIKISELDELQKATDQDLLVIVDVANNETKKIQAGNLGTGGAEIPIGPTPPENPKDGDFWIDTSANGETYGDTLPIGAIVEYNGTTVPQGYEKVSDGNFSNIYSTNEQIIGTWLGKPLYRKVIEYTFLEANTANAVTTIPNLEYFTKIEGFFIEGINRFLVPYSYNNEAINCYTSNNVLYEIHNYSFPNNKTAFITIEYTKTTD